MQKISEGKLVGGPQALIADDSYHDGVSADEHYIVTAYNSLMMRNLVTNEERQLFLSPYNGKDASGSTQVCNASMAPDTTGRCLFLDFGYPGTSTVTGGSYGIHQYLFVTNFADSMTSAIRCPANEESWDYPEWSNQPQFAVSCCRNSAGQSHSVYVVNLNYYSSRPIITGVEVQQPSIWIGEIPFNQDDSIGLYNDPAVLNGQNELAYKLHLFWKHYKVVNIVFLGTSLVSAGIDPSMFTNYKALNMAWGECGLTSTITILDNYVLPLTPNLKAVGICVPTYNFVKPEAEPQAGYLEIFIANSKGYQYDKSHGFWKPFIPDPLLQIMNSRPEAQSPDPTIDSLGHWNFSVGNWGGASPDLAGSLWTIDDPQFVENFKLFQSLADILASKKIHLVAINFPESPAYKNTDHFTRYGPSWATGKQLDQMIRNMESNPYFHFYDAYQEGNHDYVDIDASNFNHLSYIGAKKISSRLSMYIDSVLN